MFHSLLLPLELAALLCFLLVLIWRARSRRRIHSSANISEILERLEPLSRTGVEEVASDFLNPSTRQIDPRSEVRLEPGDIWNFVGGLEGVEIMLRNADVLIDLAYYVNKWHPEAVVVAEQLRLDAHEISQHLRLLKKCYRKSRIHPQVPFYLERATAAYYLMTRRVIALYEVSHAGLVPVLKTRL